MFRIHEHQVAHFARKLRADFERRMVRDLRGSFADPDVEAMARWVNAAVDKALHCGIDTEPEVGALLRIFLAIGVDADETTPWAREVLMDSRLVPEGKVRLLAQSARAHGVAGLDDIAPEDTLVPAELEEEEEALL